MQYSNLIDDFLSALANLLTQPLFFPDKIAIAGGRHPVETILIEFAFLILTMVISLKFFQLWKAGQDFQNLLFPGLMLCFVYIFSYLTFLFSTLIQYATGYTSVLKFGILVIPQLLMLYFLLIIFVRVIRFPPTRQKRFQQIISITQIIIFSMVMLAIYFIIFPASDVNPVLIGIIILNLLIFPLLFLLNRESNQTSSKLVKTRLKMQTISLFIGVFLYLLLSFFFAIFEGMFLVTGYTPEIFFLVKVMYRSPFFFAALFQYWTFRPPNWVRKRYGLFRPILT